MDMAPLLTVSYGLYIVGAGRGEKLNGQVSNTVFQVTSEPPQIAVSVNKVELTHEIITETRRCGVGVLSRDADLDFIGKFGFRSGRDVDKFADVPYFITPGGCPLPEKNVLSYIDLQVTGSHDAGTHTVFFGIVTDCGIIGEGRPMTYEYYREVLCGKSPPTAPSYVAGVSGGTISGEGKETKMKKYVCNICGYVYDPQVGDPDGGVEPGTPFEDIPDDWVCPVCGVGKDQFTQA